MQAVESADELRSKLQGYREQLAQIEELLAQDSTNADLLKLKSDMNEVIKLTSDLLNIQLSSAPAAGTASTTESGKPSYQDVNVPIGVGSRVEVHHGGYYQPAIIRDVLDGGEHYIVGFYSNLDEGETVDSGMVREIQVATRLVDLDTLAVGSNLSAKWAADGQYYDATVVGFTPHGVRINFDAYNHVDHVPPEYLAVRTRQSQAAQQSHAQRVTATATSTSRKGEQDQGSRELVIPEHLKILPTDTEKDKERKRKKIKALKNKARIRGQEEESMEKQSSWQSFVQKGKNRKAGFITTKRKESIFASPDTVDGRVGVTGSGQGMTDFDKRKKHKTETKLGF